MKTGFASLFCAVSLMIAALPAGAGGTPLPVLDKAHTAVLVTDPQNDFLREDGKLYGLLKDNLAELGTIANLD